MRQPRHVGGLPPIDIDRGLPGESARAEFERRRDADDRRRRELFGRRLAPVVKLLTGERRSTLAWELGSSGEVQVGGYLTSAVTDEAVVLHDRAIPGTRSNIDHIAIVPSGIWVIDTKHYKGRVQHRNVGGWHKREPALFVNGRDHTGLVPAVLRQAALVERIAGTEIPLHAALCFADAAWGFPSQSFSIDGVIIIWPERLAASLSDPGPLDQGDIRTAARKIALCFPRYERSGTTDATVP